MAILEFVLRGLVDTRICRTCACVLVAPWVEGPAGDLAGEAGAMAESIHGFDMTLTGGRWTVHQRRPTDESPYVFDHTRMVLSASRWIEPQGRVEDRPAVGRLRSSAIPVGRTLTLPVLEFVMRALLEARISRECACRLVLPWVEGVRGFDAVGPVEEIARAIHGLDVVVLEGVPVHGRDAGDPPYALTHQGLAEVVSRWIWAGGDVDHVPGRR